MLREIRPARNLILLNGEDITDELHPDGHCECSGEGTCAWCLLHCLECGGREDHAIHRIPLCDGGPDKVPCSKAKDHKEDHGEDLYGPHSFLTMEALKG